MDWRRGVRGHRRHRRRSNFRSYRSGIQRILAISDRQVAPADGGRLTIDAPPPPLNRGSHTRHADDRVAVALSRSA
jgi:hypothetical protein